MTDPAESLTAWAPLAALPTSSLAGLAALCQEEAFAAGETVFTMGQNDGTLVHVLTSGRARLTKADPERGDVSVEEVVGGRMIGLRAFALGDASMNGSALHAVTEVALLTIDAEELRAACLADATLCFAVLQLVAAAGRGQRRTTDPRARIYRHLLTLVRRGEGGLGIADMPRHAQLAEIAGVTDVEAASAVADLIGRGIAKRSYPGLDVIDNDALHRAAYD